MDVAIDDPGLLQNLSTELNYRLALTLNTLVQLTADAAVAIDASVNIELVNGTFLAANNVRSAIQQLAGVNARPLSPDGSFGGVIHPYVVRDVLNDTSPNGLSDILKRSPEMAEKLIKPLATDDVIEFAGARFKQTTTAPSGTVSGVTKYNTYIFGQDAIFSVFLGKNPETKEKNYRLMIQEAPAAGSVSDPARQIGGWVSYNVRFTTTNRPGSTMTSRRIQSQTASS